MTARASSRSISCCATCRAPRPSAQLAASFPGERRREPARRGRGERALSAELPAVTPIRRGCPTRPLRIDVDAAGPARASDGGRSRRCGPARGRAALDRAARQAQARAAGVIRST